jgi:hypothetical protein
MSLIDNDSEAFSGKFADFICDDREFLEGGNDHRFSIFKRLFEVSRCGIDILHDSEDLLELPNHSLELPVKHSPVGDDDNRVENPLILNIVKDRKLMSEPSDGVAFAGAGAVLDQVSASDSVALGVGDKSAHGVKLVVARKLG